MSETLCDPRDGSPPGSPVPGILQARTLEWVAISFSNAGKWKVKVKSLSRLRLLATPGTAAYQAPPSMGFSRQEYWSGVPLPSLQLLYILYKFHVYSIIACYLYSLQSDHHNKLLSITILLTPFPHFSHSLTVFPSGICSLYLWGLFCLLILLFRFHM